MPTGASVASHTCPHHHLIKLPFLVDLLFIGDRGLKVRSEREKLRMNWVVVAPFIKVGNKAEIYFVRMFIKLVLDHFQVSHFQVWDL